MTHDWKDNGNNTLYYYIIRNGLICGQIHQVSHTQIWLSKVWTQPNEEKILGLFISIEHAKDAVQSYWNVQERTLIDYGNV